MRPIEVGFFSFTEITHPGEHRAYNEWHMLDHMPEQYPLEGVAWGQRWVSTPACTAARAASRAPFDAVHYMTCYLMTEPVERTLHEFYALGRDLARRGRFHQHRTSHLSGPFAVDAKAAAPRVLVRPEAVPFRPHRGVYVVVEAAGRRVDVDALVSLPGVAGAWSFVAAGDRYGDQPWKPGARRVTVCFLDEEPTAVAFAIADRWPSGSGAELAGPMETISPGVWDWFD